MSAGYALATGQPGMTCLLELDEAARIGVDLRPIDLGGRGFTIRESRIVHKGEKLSRENFAGACLT